MTEKPAGAESVSAAGHVGRASLSSDLAQTLRHHASTQIEHGYYFYGHAATDRDVVYRRDSAARRDRGPTVGLDFRSAAHGGLGGVCCSNLQRGKIIMIHPYDPLHALVQTDEGIIDLSKEKDLKIVQVIS